MTATNETPEVETADATYTLTMRDDGGSEETVDLDEGFTSADITAACEEWVKDGDWGTDGASVSVRWTITDADGDEIDSGYETVEVEQDHESGIAAVIGATWDATYERCCGLSLEDHDWTSEGEGGCDQNPGVWSTGGTSMTFASHCRTCGLHRKQYQCGSQRNPGDHDRTVYEMPETWCESCEKEECDCDE